MTDDFERNLVPASSLRGKTALRSTAPLKLEIRLPPAIFIAMVEVTADQSTVSEPACSVYAVNQMSIINLNGALAFHRLKIWFSQFPAP